jgi:hypothetical protein
MPFSNILEFVEGPDGLRWTLYPVQRLILKIYYGLELDNTQRTITVTDRFQEEDLYRLTEQEYLGYLYGEGRCSVREQDTITRNNIVLVMGRRTGKTLLEAVIANYEIIQLLQAGNPHETLGLSLSQMLEVRCVTFSSNMVQHITDMLSTQVDTVQDLRTARSGHSRSGITFRTPAMDHTGIPQRGNLRLRVVTGQPQIHGTSCSALIFDELAHIQNEQEVTQAHLPSLLTPGRYAMLSTPRRASGSLYSHFVHAMQSRAPETPLALQIPTWEVQPSMGEGFLRRSFEEDPMRFLVEYGAEWQANPHRVVTINITI